MPPPPLRIGFVPEHFSTPLHFAAKHFGLNAKRIPFPSGTGHMIQALKARDIDVGIGLTEGWVAGLGKEKPGKAPYKLVGTYVETPLCWAISTGVKRDIHSISQLRNARVGVSRIGSGSYVMSFVLADQQGWLKAAGEPPFEIVPLQTFAGLRDGVNGDAADFFMWEHFTSKRYYDSGEIRRVGDIYTPWSSWKIVAADAADERLPGMFDAIDRGVAHFEQNRDESVKYISTELDYSAQDATDWLRTVKFASAVKGVRRSVIADTIDVLRKAGVIEDKTVRAEDMIGITREPEDRDPGTQAAKEAAFQPS